LRNLQGSSRDENLRRTETAQEEASGGSGDIGKRLDIKDRTIG